MSGESTGRLGLSVVQSPIRESPVGLPVRTASVLTTPIVSAHRCRTRMNRSRPGYPSLRSRRFRSSAGLTPRMNRAERIVVVLSADRGHSPLTLRLLCARSPSSLTLPFRLPLRSFRDRSPITARVVVVSRQRRFSVLLAMAPRRSRECTGVRRFGKALTAQRISCPAETHHASLLLQRPCVGLARLLALRDTLNTLQIVTVSRLRILCGAPGVSG